METSGVADLFARVARGEYVPPLSASIGASLLQRARKLLEEDPSQADGALRVAAFVGGYGATTFLKDCVRSGRGPVPMLALDWAARAGTWGIPAVREALDSRDPALVEAAYRRLGLHGDASGTSRARAHLRGSHPGIKTAAATYLGQVAGPSVVPDLQALLRAPPAGQAPQPQAREAAALAIERIERRAPRDPVEPWPPLPQEVVPLRVPPVERPPTDLTDQPRDLLRHLGRGDERDRERIIAGLKAASQADLAAVIRPMDLGAQADLAVGACRLARFDQDRRWVLTVRRLLAHPEPWVRHEAALAMEGVGSRSDLPFLEALSQDPAPEIREAALRARQVLSGEPVPEAATDLPRLEGPQPPAPPEEP